jgi:hypothetical protein
MAAIDSSLLLAYYSSLNLFPLSGGAMKIVVGSEKFSLRNDHPYAKAIVALARAYPGAPKSAYSVPERNDVKQLWHELSDSHKRLLREIANRPNGISQPDLENLLAVDWQGLRGVHNGLARICERFACEKPVRVVGYNSMNRRYLMDPDVAATVQKLSK